MTFLNAQQLAFILDIKKVEARAKMIHAYASDKRENVKARYVDKKLVEDFAYPEAMSIEVLSRECNLPDLQKCVDDINQNYLSRAASKKWILCDYPEKQILKMKESGEKKRIRIPAALRSMLPVATTLEIESEWAKRFPAYNGVEAPIEE